MASIDLNLMTVLDALLQEQHVSRAAARVGRSQPAVSSALGRLREIFGDPLLVRTQQGMIPTARAKEIRPLVEAALEQLRAALNDQQFDPLTSTRHFVIAQADVSAAHFLPRILPELRRQAPHVTISVVEAWSNEAVEALQRGQVDFAIGVFAPQQEEFGSKPLVQMKEVCIGDAANAAINNGPLSFEAFLRIPKIILERRDSGTVINSVLSTAGHGSNVVLRLPQFLGAARAVLGTDLVVVIPDAMVEDLPDRDLYSVASLGFQMPEVQVSLIWNRRYNVDAAHSWFRELTCRCAVAI
ncbi:LysR family transcriptional regulator [Rhizobium sp. P38BS-XIX]|uniref:LysR family transcriptional regulator n=1 Tax=Rhizobium sp. P38BS-XIX TaxID=2726740 RepID=UPI001981AD84|nr:LysR family transcriptional regulator [Rhizobium sp. P38BS-XIX]